MAKISKINIAITGDAKGFAAATDAAVREMRRLQVQSETTSKRLNQQRSALNKTSEAVAKLGVSSKALSGVSGAMGLLQMGAPGIALGGTAIAGAGVMAVINALQRVPEMQERVRKALEETSLDARKRIQEAGFSPQLAAAVAANAPGAMTPAQRLGVMDSFTAGIASGKAGAVAGDILTTGLGATSTFAGAIVGGAGVTQAAQLAGSQAVTGDQIADGMRAYHMNMATTSPGGPIGYLLGLFWSK